MRKTWREDSLEKRKKEKDKREKAREGMEEKRGTNRLVEVNGLLLNADLLLLRLVGLAFLLELLGDLLVDGRDGGNDGLGHDNGG